MTASCTPAERPSSCTDALTARCRALRPGHHPLGVDLRNAVVADADDVARLLCELGYPCDLDDAIERISAILDNDRQALVVARLTVRCAAPGRAGFMYYLPLGTTTCRVTALVVTPDRAGPGHRPRLAEGSQTPGALAGAAASSSPAARSARGACVLPRLRLQGQFGPHGELLGA